MRQSIFEKMDNLWDFSSALTRINKLFEKEKLMVIDDRAYYSLREFFAKYCFDKWISNCHRVNFDDFLNELKYSQLLSNAVHFQSEDDMISYIEIIANCIYVFERQYPPEMKNIGHCVHTLPKFNALKGNIYDVLDNLNMDIKYVPDRERVLLLEKNAAVTAAAEISSDETAYEIITYNHHTLKGDIKEKAKILSYLANGFEAQRGMINRINFDLANDIACLLNNLNIRHNNVDQSVRSYHSTVADMSSTELESWYDELYQMLLLARLEIDNIERKKKVSELKEKMEGERRNNG